MEKVLKKNLTFIGRKTIVFDMDETLIHCVDDIDQENPDVIIPIDFPDEDEPVNVTILLIHSIGWYQCETIPL